MAEHSRATSRGAAPHHQTNGPAASVRQPDTAGGASAREAAAATNAEPSEAGRDARAQDRPSVAVDVVILTVRNGRLEVLLNRRRRWPYDGVWALPGGFITMDESLEDAARRELDEAIGVRDVYLEQLYTFGDPGRDPRTRVVTVVYYALLRAEHLALGASGQDEDIAWFAMYEPPELAFDHDEILRYTSQRLRGKLEYTKIGYQLLGKEFTLSELQNVYEAILGRDLDKRNFRRKVLQTGILVATPRTRRAGQHRPARLYRFNPEAEP